MSPEDLETAKKLETFKMKAQGRIEMLRAVISYEQFALKTCFILNSGALVAFLGVASALETNTRRFSGKLDDLRTAVWLWIAGVIVSALAIGVGYLSQQRFYESDAIFANLEDAQRALRELQGYKHRRIAIAFSALSIILFALACIFAKGGLL